MQINSVVNPQIIQYKQNFKGSSANSSPFSTFLKYQPIPLNVSEAYVSPQISQGYREIKTFDVPYVGQGKLYELSNGHRVAIVKKTGPTTINTFVNVGWKDSPITSHLLEHLIYDERKNIDGTRLSEEFASLGVRPNANTNYNYTNYFITYPYNNSKDIDRLIKIQSNLLQNPSFSKEIFEKEKKIIFAEYEGCKTKKKLDNKDEIFLDALLDTNKKAEKTDYSKNAINKISFDELINFYNQNYTNNNMVSVVVGDVNSDEIIKLFSKYFNKKNTNNKIKTTDNKVVLNETKRLDVPHDLYFADPINVGFVGPKINNLKDIFLAAALSVYVNEYSKYPEKTSIKMENIVNGGSPNDDLGLKFNISSLNGTDENINILNKYLKELVQKPIANSEIEKIKTEFKNKYSFLAENSEDISSTIGNSLIQENDQNFLDLYKYIDTLTAEELQNFIKKYINPEKQLTVVYYQNIPSNENKQLSFKGLGNVNAINTDNIKEYSCPSNLNLIVDTSPEIKRTTFSIELNRHYLPQKNAKTYFALEKILEHKSNIETRGDSNIIELNYDLDNIQISVNSLPENTIEAINSAKKLILNPDFDKNDLDRIKKEYHGDKENIDEVKLSDVVNLYNDLISVSEGKAVLTIPQDEFNKNQNFIIADINKDFPLLLKPFGEILSNNNKPQKVDKTKVIFEESYSNIAEINEVFDIVSSTKIDKKDSVSLYLLNQILGEGQNSRLFKDIREDKALAYSLFPLYCQTQKEGLFEITVEIPIEKTNSSDIQKILSSYKNNIDNLITTPISEKELNQAKTLLKGKYMLKLESSSSRNKLLSQFSMNELKDLFNTIDGITPTDIQNTAIEYLDKPSEISIKANQEVIDLNKDYLSTIGEIIQI